MFGRLSGCCCSLCHCLFCWRRDADDVNDLDDINDVDCDNGSCYIFSTSTGSLAHAYFNENLFVRTSWRLWCAYDYELNYMYVGLNMSHTHTPTAASIWFEVWGVVNPVAKIFDSRREKNHIFQAVASLGLVSSGAIIAVPPKFLGTFFKWKFVQFLVFYKKFNSSPKEFHDCF